MSLILDALNKADRQRDRRDTVPNLSSHEPAPVPPKQNFVPLWAILSIIGLLLAVVLVLVLLLLRNPMQAPSELNVGIAAESREEQAVVGTKQPLAHKLPNNQSLLAESAPPSSHNTPVKSDEDTVPAQRVESAKPQSPEPALSPKVAAIYAQVGAPSDQATGAIADLYKSTSRPGTNKTTAAKTVDSLEPKLESVPTLQPEISQSKPRVPADQLMSYEELEELWRQTQLEAQLQTQPEVPYANIPFLYQLPESFQQRIPTLIYQNHIYSPRASAVIVNGKTYRKGDTIAPDLVLDDITEDGVLLTYLEKPFRLAALSSWVKK